MCRCVFLSLLMLLGFQLWAQRVVFDRGHFDIVNENGAVRLAAENMHNAYLNTINQRLSDIKLNMSAVVMVQKLILSSLSEVDQALKNAIALKQITSLSSEIISESSRMVSAAGSDPHLLLFAQDIARQMKERGMNLFLEVSSFVLKEGGNVLMDFEKRDALLAKIALELRLIRSLIFSMQKSMYWAKMNGMLKSVNPFQGFISRDARLADEVLFNYDLLKQKR